jgi:hypothetical protein
MYAGQARDYLIGEAVAPVPPMAKKATVPKDPNAPKKKRCQYPPGTLRGITIERLREAFQYFPDSGRIRWRIAGRRHRVGDLAGYDNHCMTTTWGEKLYYRRITLDGVSMYGHQIAYVLMTGEVAGDCELDHENHNGLDNRWVNIVRKSTSDNHKNRRSNWDMEDLFA